MRNNDTVRVFETLDGLEAHAQDGRIFLLRDYRKYRQMFYDPWRKEQLPFSFRFEALNFTPVIFNARRMIMRGEEYIKPARNRPRIAVAQ
jgi:hypothetical protein